MSVYNNELFNILEEDDNLIATIADEKNESQDVELEELQDIIQQIRKDYISTICELSELRQVVYSNVHHLSEKAIGDYAEIGFILSKKYIRRYGMYIFMADLMQTCSELIPPNHFLRMVPAFKSAEGHYVVTLLCTSTIDINFSKVCMRIADMYCIKEQIILYVDHQSSKGVQTSFEQCLLSFENDYHDFTSDAVPIHYEIESNKSCEIKTSRMQLCHSSILDVHE